MKILTLIENTRNSKKLYCEHGLSLYIELGDKKILVDTGASERFAKNALRLGVDLTKLDSAVISHNHYDHTGGLETLFKIAPNIKVFAKKAVNGSYYRKTGPFKITICWNKHFLNRHRDNFILFNHFQEVCEGLYLMGCEVFNENDKIYDRRLLKKENKLYTPDDFAHELFLVAFPYKEREKGCVVISSCSHNGIVNILETVKKTWVDSPIIGVVGGFHLKNAQGVDSHLIKHMSKRLGELSSGCIYTCHCTGEKAYEQLKSKLSDQIQTLRTGEELIF